MANRLLVTELMVRDLPVMADIGIHPHEIDRRQPLIVSVTLTIDAVASDAIEATVDYRRIAQLAHELADLRIALIETFGYRLASSCLDFPGVRQALVKIDKPQALSAGMASVAVQLRHHASPTRRPEPMNDLGATA